MAKVIVTMRLMPSSPDVDWNSIEESIKKIIEQFGAEFGKASIEPVAFGLKSYNPVFIMDENLGSTDEIEAKLSDLNGVESVEVTDVRRAIG